MTAEDGIVDRGTGSIAFAEFSDQQGTLIGSNLIIVHRLGMSDRLVYKHFLPRLIENDIIVIFSFPKKYIAAIQPVEIFRKKDWNIESLIPQNVYQIHTNSQEEIAKELSIIRVKIFPRSIESVPIVLLVDTLHKFNPYLENELRNIIHEASFSNFSVWLHCPLHNIPIDLITTIGNIIAIWPTENEIEIISRHLPIGEIDLPGSTLSEGMMGYGYDLFGKKRLFYQKIGTE